MVTMTMSAVLSVLAVVESVMLWLLCLTACAAHALYAAPT
jgi:hypothetical protein